MRIQPLIPVLILSLLHGIDAFGGPWYVEPEARVRVGYEDNVRLEPSDDADDDSTLSSYLDLRAPFGYRSEVSDIRISAQLESRRYDSHTDLNTDDQILDLNAVFRSAAHLFGLQGRYERDSTHTSELATTGLVQSSKRRIVRYLSPHWTRVLTERTSLNLNYRYTDITYQDADPEYLTDYRYDTASLDFLHRLSERSGLRGTLTVAKYRAPDVDTQFQTLGLQAGIVFEPSDLLSARFAIGLAKTESDHPGIGLIHETSDDSTVLLDLSLKRNYETMVIEGTLSTSEVPSSRGRLLRQNSFGFTLYRDLSPRIYVSFRGQVFQSSSAGGLDDASDDRLYYSLEPRLSWRATRSWTVVCEYRYRRQDYTKSPAGAADSNGVFVTVNYSSPRETQSRWLVY